MEGGSIDQTISITRSRGSPIPAIFAENVQVIGRDEELKFVQ